jgi:hypothetical protein
LSSLAVRDHAAARLADPRRGQWSLLPSAPTAPRAVAPVRARSGVSRDNARAAIPARGLSGASVLVGLQSERVQG